MPADNSSAGILVFAKAPVVGRVKTRLLPLLSEQQACELHCRLLDRTLHSALETGLAAELWCGESHPELTGRGELHKLACYLQQGSDLGEKMANAARSALQRYRRVLIIGSDCPGITPQYLLSGVEALGHCDVVLGPAIDGGYVMIGVTADHPRLFADVAWGGATVLASTRDNIARCGLASFELDSLADIDRPEDLLAARPRWPDLFAGLSERL